MLDAITDSTKSTTAKKPALADALLQKKLDIAKAFTRAYQKHRNDHVAIREAMCLKEQYPAMCREIRAGDLIAGRMHYFPLVGFGIELYGNRRMPVLYEDNMPWEKLPAETRWLKEMLGTSTSAYFYDYGDLTDLAARLDPAGEQKEDIDELLAFWLTEATRYKYNQALTDEIKQNTDRTEGHIRYAGIFFRVCCCSVDFDKLLQLGIPGMAALIEEKKSHAASTGGDARLYEGMLLALDVLINVCKHYRDEAYTLALGCQDPATKAELAAMAEVLDKLTYRKPGSLHEAIQLCWLYNICTQTLNYGRMDVYLGDFYCHDLDAGVLSEQQAQKLLQALWQIMADQRTDGWNNSEANCRIIVGGKGRRNVKNADRFAMAAMETSRVMNLREPNVTLRFYDGQNPQLMKKALDLIGQGCIHPGLYNDDVHIPAVQRAYNVPLEDAEQYIPEGCGEIMLDHRSIGSPNGLFKFVAGLDLVLHNGYCTETGVQRGLKLGELREFDTFDKLLNAWKKQIDFTNLILAKRHRLELDVVRKEAAFLFMSMLTDDCIERGKSLLDDGTRYLGGIIETFGLTNVADSLYAIKTLVYDKKVMTLEKLVEILDANFEGYDRERQMMLDLPKFGNDHAGVDAMQVEVSRFVCQSAQSKASQTGLHFFLNCSLNPGAITYSKNAKASADGRRFGDPFAVGNAPTAGRDTSGITALFNSMAKCDKANAGYVQNLKTSRDMFSPVNRPKIEAMITTYFKAGGCQLMVTTLNRGDLENALKEPSKYPNLLVRVGGWTSRFVDLKPEVQREILNRTFYE